MEIVGFMPDIKFASFRMEVSPMAFYVWDTEVWGKDMGSEPNWAYIKVKAVSDMHAAMEHVKASLLTFDPDYPLGSASSTM